MSTSDDKAMLDLAARLAYRATGYVEPNPLVGCVIVRPARAGEEGLPIRDRIIGMGHHRKFGGLHAEREALESCRRGGHDPAGATVYVTLEPCNGHGKQPPCVEALIAAKVAEVVYVSPDFSPKKGRGGQALAAAGIRVRPSWSLHASALWHPFMKRLGCQLPYTIVKWAQTIDGKLATSTGESKWISNWRSRRMVHQLRGRVDAILTSVGTLLADNPRLTARDARSRRVATRIVLDTRGDRSVSELLQGRAILKEAERIRTVFIGMAHPEKVAAGDREFCERHHVQLLTLPPLADGTPTPLWEVFRLIVDKLDVTNMLVEAGPRLIGRIIRDELVDEAHVYTAPMVLGDSAAPGVAWRAAPTFENTPQLSVRSIKQVGEDIRAVYRFPLRMPRS